MHCCVAADIQHLVGVCWPNLLGIHRQQCRGCGRLEHRRLRAHERVSCPPAPPIHWSRQLLTAPLPCPLACLLRRCRRRPPRAALLIDGRLHNRQYRATQSTPPHPAMLRRCRSRAAPQMETLRAHRRWCSRPWFVPPRWCRRRRRWYAHRASTFPTTTHRQSATTTLPMSQIPTLCRSAAQVC
jgi:hypothetical protein